MTGRSGRCKKSSLTSSIILFRVKKIEMVTLRIVLKEVMSEGTPCDNREPNDDETS